MQINNLEEREQLKNKAVELRESGKLDEALEIFKNIVEWDENNSNLQGAVDVLGHIRIAYTRLAEENESHEKKIEYMKGAKDVLEKATNILKSNPDIDGGVLAVLNVHKASTIFTSAILEKSQNYSEEMRVALETINNAIENLPGSIAHKSWPSLAKSRILYELGQIDEALDTLSQGEKWLFQGYDEEMQNSDQGELKLKVWQAGLFLGKAEIFSKEKKPILALHYAQAVLAIEDTQNHLGERKKEAQRIIKSLSITVSIILAIHSTISGV